MNLPNQITLARLGITGLFVVLLTVEVRHGWSWAAVLFIIACLTDYLDGYLARTRGLVTSFGALMDPLVDKVLVCSAFILLSCAVREPSGAATDAADVQFAGLVPPWVTVLVVAREFLVTGLRLVAASQGAVLSADWWGKWKTGAQIAVLVYALMFLAVREPPFAWFAPFFEVKVLSPPFLGRLFLWLAVFTTVWSGIRYLLNNRHIIRDR